jgi:hypothetical protein
MNWYKLQFKKKTVFRLFKIIFELSFFFQGKQYILLLSNVSLLIKTSIRYNHMNGMTHLCYLISVCY